jgi:RimJ/RimL family protein N-acetyltransferase
MSKLPNTLKSALSIRLTRNEDAPHLLRWLEDPEVGRWFPMEDHVEREDAVNRWIWLSRYNCSLTATLNDEPAGIATLYLQPYLKLVHQCEFGIIVAPEWRNLGVGTYLMEALEGLAKENFGITLLHLQVYEGNPATRLYLRMGYKEFGYQKKWIKETDGTYVGRSFMEKEL